MRILFAHKHFPGQFAHLAAVLAAEAGSDVVFLHGEGEGTISGVRTCRVTPRRAASKTTHHYLQSFEDAVLLGQAVYRACLHLAGQGFRPDVIYAHAGFGSGLYLKDAFPDTPLIGYFEWFYEARGGDGDYLDPGDISEDDVLRLRTRNAAILLELCQASRGICPTAFQKSRFPPELQRKLSVLHDGVDTDFFAPASSAAAELAVSGLPADAEVVTYATRGLEPYRGFPQFMEALALLQKRRPRLHAIIAGSDRVFYSRPAPAGQTYKQWVLDRLPGLDRSRLHFVDFLPLADYRGVLRTSAVHVYLTVPFVLSWSLIEAMATGCAIVASDTPPVREVMQHGREGLLVDMLSPPAIAGAIDAVLDDRALAARLGDAARRTAVRFYSLASLQPRQLRFIREVAAHGSPAPAGRRRDRQAACAP